MVKIYQSGLSIKQHRSTNWVKAFHDNCYYIVYMYVGQVLGFYTYIVT